MLVVTSLFSFRACFSFLISSILSLMSFMESLSLHQQLPSKDWSLADIDSKREVKIADHAQNYMNSLEMGGLWIYYCLQNSISLESCSISGVVMLRAVPCTPTLGYLCILFSSPSSIPPHSHSPIATPHACHSHQINSSLSFFLL